MAEEPLVFYDGECGLCDWAVRFLLRIDRAGILWYAPLQGSTAAERLQPLPDRDSLVLLEGKRRSMEAKAIFRICWLIGGIWKLPGLLHFLPSWLFNWAYRLVARNRKKFFKKKPFCELPADCSRFLS